MAKDPAYLDLRIVENTLLGLPTCHDISGSITIAGEIISTGSLLSKKERKKIFKLLKLYRDTDNQTKITADTVNGLGVLLQNLVGPNSKLEDFPSVLLRVKREYLRFVTNIPWELAALKTIDPISTPDFSMLLADRPIARTIEGCPARVPPPGDEKLRVHYCISDPGGNLQAQDFKKELDNSLKECETFINKSVTEGQVLPFKPEFSQLLADITLNKPDILILISHGRSKNGKPEVRFDSGWEPVDAIAGILEQTGNNSLVIFIACDLTFASESEPSQSGAASFITRGVPAVVAMQSSIRVSCGKILLDSVITYLFTLIWEGQEDGSLLRSMAFARRRIFETFQDSQMTNLDWSYPALFVSSGNENGLGKMRYCQLGYVSALRNIRAKNFLLQQSYFSRPGPEQQLAQIFASVTKGVHSISGPPGCGKTILLNHAGDKYYAGIIANQTKGFRHLIYVDFDMEQCRRLGNPIELFNAINEKIGTIAPTQIAVKLVQKLKLPGSSYTKKDEIDRMVLEMDSKKVIYILDNLDQEQYNNLLELLKTAEHDFKESLLIVPGYTADFHSLLQVDQLTLPETLQYLAQRGGQLDGEQAFLQTGGNFASLQLMKRQPGAYLQVVITQQENFERMLDTIGAMGDVHLRAMSILSQFDKGLTKELAEYTRTKWEILSDLRSLGMAAVRQNEKNDEIIFMPKLSRQYLSNDQPDLLSFGRNTLLETFYEFPKKNTSAIAEILSVVGGFDFLLTVLRLEKANFDQSGSAESLKKIHSILYYSYEPLFASSRWGLALELIQYHNRSTNPDYLRAIDLIREGKTAEVLGMQTLLNQCIQQAETKNPSRMEIVMILQLKAAHSKISGNMSLLPQMLDQYKQAEQILKGMDDNPDQREGYNTKEITDRNGMVLYNRSIVQYWWALNEREAFNDIQKAIACFHEAGNEIMYHVGLSEYADMRLKGASNRETLDTIIQDLLMARNYFSKNNISGDLATVYLRLGRAYSKYAFVEADVKISLQQKAVDHYIEAAVLSHGAGMELQELVARGHTSILQGPGFLERFTVQETSQRISDVLEGLKVFEGHSWARRVLRNMSWQKAQLADPAHLNPKLIILYEALDHSLSGQLHRNSESDRRIAVQIIHECVALIGQDIHEWNEFVVRFRDAICGWFNVQQFSTKADMLQSLNTIPPLKPY